MWSGCTDPLLGLILPSRFYGQETSLPPTRVSAPPSRPIQVPDKHHNLPQWMLDDLDELDKDLKNPNRYSIDENDLKRWGACSLKVFIL